MPSESGDSQLRLWEVFVQEEAGAAHIHSGSVRAADAEMALQNARDVYARRGELKSLWVVSSEAIHATTPDDSPAFFDPAPDKIYRHPQFYETPAGVKNL